MSQLSDTQLVILSTAAGRDDGAVLPLAKSLKLRGGAANKTLGSLLQKGLLAETRALPAQEIWCREDDCPLTLVISDAGRAAIGIESSEASSQAAPDGDAKEKVAALSSAGTKQARIVTLLRREHGATLDELVAETGWLPHTTRAALTRLRQKGITISRTSEDGRGSVYRLVGDA